MLNSLYVPRANLIIVKNKCVWKKCTACTKLITGTSEPLGIFSDISAHFLCVCFCFLHRAWKIIRGREEKMWIAKFEINFCSFTEKLCKLFICIVLTPCACLMSLLPIFFYADAHHCLRSCSLRSISFPMTIRGNLVRNLQIENWCGIRYGRLCDASR